MQKTIPAVRLAESFMGQAQQFLLRETSPQSHRTWLEEKQNEREVIEASFAEWLQSVSMAESLFKTHVYENPSLDEWDLRQHRARLHAMISDGEIISMRFLDLGQRTNTMAEIMPQVKVLEAKLKSQFETLIAWHAPAESQSDIPDSFKQSMREADAGNIVELDV